MFSSGQLEGATSETLAFQFGAGRRQPDQATRATFRTTFWAQTQALFGQVLRLAQAVGVLKVGPISRAGRKRQADASTRKAVSHNPRRQLAERLRAEVHALLNLGESADQGAVNWPGGWVIADEITRRQLRLENLATAQAVLEGRAQERYEAGPAAYDAQVRAREDKAIGRRRRPGRKPPQPGRPDTDQYTFSAPDWPIMKTSTDDGFDQHYTVPVALDPASLFSVACRLSNHPNATAEAEATRAARAPQLGQVAAAALANALFSPTNSAACEQPASQPSLATRRHAQQQPWQTFCAEAPRPPPDSASPKVKLAFKLHPEIGPDRDRLRQGTVESVLGIIKDGLGLRPFALRGLLAAAGE